MKNKDRNKADTIQEDIEYLKEIREYCMNNPREAIDMIDGWILLCNQRKHHRKA